MSVGEDSIRSLDDALVPRPIGNWTILSEQTAAPDLRVLIEQFEPLDKPGGREAARWLKEEALGQDGMTRTHLLLNDEGDKLLGYFSCCTSQVQLTKKTIVSLGLKTKRTLMPAFLLCWVARAKGETVGRDLIATAYGLAQDAAKTVGIVAFVLDPIDEAVASVWRAAPYYFQNSSSIPRKDGPPRLWLPII